MRAIKNFEQFKVSAEPEKVNESEIIDISDESTFPKKQQSSNEYFVIHHTAGGGTAQDVIDILNKRNLSVQWIVDKEGKIYRGLPPNSIAYHAGRPAAKDLMPAVQNSNSQGVEVIGLNDEDIKSQFDRDIQKYGYPRQAEAVRKIIKFLGYPKQNIVGHGEITTTKQETEGKTIKNYVLTNWDKPVDLTGLRGPDRKADYSLKNSSSIVSEPSATEKPTSLSSSPDSTSLIDSAFIYKFVEKLKERNFRQAVSKKDEVVVKSGAGQRFKSSKISAENMSIIQNAMDKHGITNDFARRAILGVISKESSSAASEYGYEKTANSHIRKTFGKRTADLSDSELDKLKSNSEDFFNFVYSNINGNTEPGDGYKYRGRGFNGITGKGNYANLQKVYNEMGGGPVDIVKNPEALETPSIAAEFAILYFIRSFKTHFGSDPITKMNSYTSLESAVTDFVQSNHGWNNPLSGYIGGIGLSRAMEFAKSLSPDSSVASSTA